VARPIHRPRQREPAREGPRSILVYLGKGSLNEDLILKRRMEPAAPRPPPRARPAWRNQPHQTSSARVDIIDIVINAVVILISLRTEVVVPA